MGGRDDAARYLAIPGWFSPANKGASAPVGDVTGNGTSDLIVLAVDRGQQPNRAGYRIGRDLDAAGNVTGGWLPWMQIPDWFSQDTQGAGIAVADLNGNGKVDLVILMVDNQPQLNRGARPVIGQVATEWRYGQAADIATPRPDTILWAELIRGGVTTHACDNSQRLVDLPITARTAAGLTVSTPATPMLAPPGWYMLFLFLVDQNRVPSTATWIHLT